MNLFSLGLAILALLVCGPRVLAAIGRQQPDPAIARYRLGAVVKFAGFDEALYHRFQFRCIEQTRKVLMLRRRRILKRLAELEQARRAPVVSIASRPRRSA